MSDGYLRIAMADSERGKMWTLERAQGAVKAAFFAKEVQEPESSEDPKLHFSEIRRLGGKNERPISDRTLSRAISSLIARGQLEKTGSRKGIEYRLVISKSERVKAFARTDSAWVERSAEVGGIGDGERGFAFYGIPEIFREKYRHRLQREA